MARPEEGSTFGRPGFVIAGVVVVLITVLGIVIGATSGRASQPAPAATPDASSTPSSPAVAPSGQAEPSASPSLPACPDIDASAEPAGLASAPATQWRFQGSLPYPSSAAAGPRVDDEHGRRCFARSSTGALFAAANAVSQGSDPQRVDAWADVALAQGTYRARVRAGLQSSSRGSSPARLEISGYRMLAHEGDRARVDVAVRASTSTGTVLTSGVCELVWQNGDWRISTDVPEPLTLVRIPDMAGYVWWGE